MLYAPATWMNVDKKPTVMTRIGKEGIIEGIQEFLKNPTKVMGRIPPEFNREKIREGHLKFVRKSLEQIGENPEDYLGEAE